MGRDPQGNPLVFPPCNLGGEIWFEADGSPEEIRRRIESHLSISLQDDASEVDEHSYRSTVFGFEILLKVDPRWPSGTLCHLFAMTHANLGIYDFEAPVIPFERHLAGVVDRLGLGRLISGEEVQRARQATRPA